jgi:hypothetical protein
LSNRIGSKQFFQVVDLDSLAYDSLYGNSII